MKSLCKSLLIGLVIGVTSMLPISKAYCQSATEPAVVISIANFKEQMDDVNYLLTASGFAEMKFMASAMIKGYTKGLDAEKDAGVMLYFNEDSPEPDFLGFVPVVNLTEVLDVVAGMAQVEEDDEYSTIITDDGTEFVVKEQDGYAFFTNNQEILETLPDSPVEVLGGLSEKYNLSARVYGQRIPEALRDQALGMIRESSEMTLENLGDDLQADLQRKNLEMQMKQMEMMLHETDTVTLGMKADKEAKKLVMDIEFTGLPNSELAAKLAAGARKKASRFSGFLMEGATFTLNNCANLNSEDATQYSGMLDDLSSSVIQELDADGEMTEEEIDAIEKALDGLVDVAKATLKEGIFDSGACLMLNDGKINFAGGVHIAAPKKFENTVKELVAMAETKMGEAIEVNLNSGNHKDITLHTIVVQVPEEENEMRTALGEEITLVVGIGKKAVYFGAGSNPIDTLKKAVDDSTEVSDMMQFNLYVTPILEFASGMEGDPAVEAMAAALSESGGDRIRGTYNLIENGGAMRFEMQDGILGLIKVGFDAFSQSGGGFPGADDDF